MVLYLQSTLRGEPCVRLLSPGETNCWNPNDSGSVKFVRDCQLPSCSRMTPPRKLVLNNGASLRDLSVWPSDLGDFGYQMNLGSIWNIIMLCAWSSVLYDFSGLG